jgi:predicted phage tail protein|nr:MAG TPA: tail protein [Caudoviricetes sp.]
MKVKGGWRVIQGAKKGGGGSSGGKEDRDSLHSASYARIVDLLSEGEIVGPVDGLKSVYFDETPVLSSDGTANFSGYDIQFRSGTQDQDPVSGLPASESTTSVGVEFKASTPWTHTFTNTELDAVRVTLAVSGLQKVNQKNGNITGYRVDYTIELSSNGGPYSTVVSSAFDGKTTSTYARSHRIDLPSGGAPWTVRVSRSTADSSTNYISDTTLVQAYTEIIDAKLRYPMSALAAIKIDASQFSSIPTRAYHLKGRIIRVPSNYDADKRTYTGTWDGTFKTAYSNNPAWVFYDILTNDRYGLGDVLDAGYIDKWSLYEIGQYCDESVPTGVGSNTEPRFTCNCYLQSAADATTVLIDLATAFRGIVYWGNGSAIPVADMPRDPSYTYTAANVIDGKFQYQGSARSTRYTVCYVSYNDPDDMYNTKVEAVEDADGIARYGIVATSITAFSCSSRSQAHRLGLWTLLTSQRETRSVTFSVGLDGAIATPGQIIRIADPAIAGKRVGGRLHAVNSTTQVVVDKNDGIAVGDTLICTLPSGKTESQTVSAVDGTAITVGTAFSAAPEPESIWAVVNSDLQTQTFRVVSVTEGDGSTFDIAAIQNEQSKYAAVDYGSALSDTIITSIPESSVPAPSDLKITSNEVVEQGISSTTVTLSWTKPEVTGGVGYYILEWKRDNSDWITVPQVASCSYDITNAYRGTYQFRIRATNTVGVKSPWKASDAVSIDGLLAAPASPASLVASSEIFGITLNWGFPSGLNILSYTEIWYSATNDRTAATLLTMLPYPQARYTLTGLKSGQTFYFWARLVDKNGLAGDYYPASATDGVEGTSSTDAANILGYLTNKITSTQLGGDLMSEIGTASSTATEAKNAADNAQSIVSSIESQISRAPDAEGDLADVLNEWSSRASITQLQKTSSSNEEALAGLDTKLSAKISQNSADIETNATAIAKADGTLSSAYTVKTGITAGGKYYAAGFAVGVDNSSGSVQSQFLVNADTFAILNSTASGGTVTSPFTVSGGQVYMDSALIQDASISNVKIADASISNAKIQDGAITSVKIGDAAITNAKIQDASVTNLKIGSNAVDFYKILDGAVTGTAGASGESISYTAVSGSRMIIIFSCYLMGTTSSDDSSSAYFAGGSAELYRNGTHLATYCTGGWTGGIGVDHTLTFAYFDSPGSAGTYTYSVSVSPYNLSIVRTESIAVIEMKR